MAANDITYSYTDIYCTTGTVDGHSDVVLAVQFAFKAERNGKTVQNAILYTYEDPIFDDSNPYTAFDDWKSQKMYGLLDSLVLAYKWKSDLRAKLDAADKNLTLRPIEETITTHVQTPEAVENTPQESEAS